MEDPNGLAVELVDEAIDFADALHIDVRHLDSDAAVLDFGIGTPGGLEAGLLLAEVATGGLATISARLGTVDGAALSHVEVSTDHPATALAGCQDPHWDLSAAGIDAPAAGPAQLLVEAVRPTDVVGPAEPAGFAVATLEADRLPGDDLAEAVAAAAGVPTSAVFLLVAPANSQAGAVAAAARVGARAVAALGRAGVEPGAVRSVDASAPVAPLAGRPSESRARSMAAVAGGGRAQALTAADLTSPDALEGPGAARGGPAQLTLDVVDGPVHVVGSVDEASLAADLGL